VDSFVELGIPIGEKGETSLSGFMAKSIVGSLNEIKDGSTEWTENTIDANNINLVPNDYGSGTEYIHVGSGMIDEYIDVNNSIRIGETGDTSLSAWYSKSSILGCFNKLAGFCNFMHAERITSPQSILTSPTGIILNDEIEDPESAYNPTTGVYTVPSNGYYMVQVNLNINISTPATDIHAKILNDATNLAEASYEKGNTGVRSINMLALCDASASSSITVTILASIAGSTILANSKSHIKIYRFGQD